MSAGKKSPPVHKDRGLQRRKTHKARRRAVQNKAWYKAEKLARKKRAALKALHMVIYGGRRFGKSMMRDHLEYLNRYGAKPSKLFTPTPVFPDVDFGLIEARVVSHFIKTRSGVHFTFDMESEPLVSLDPLLIDNPENKS